jgi:hypothetical protein
VTRGFRWHRFSVSLLNGTQPHRGLQQQEKEVRPRNRLETTSDRSTNVRGFGAGVSTAMSFGSSDERLKWNGVTNPPPREWM